MNEGEKVLFRVAYGILRILKKTILSEGTDPSKIMAILVEIPKRIFEDRAYKEKLMKKAYKLLIRRKDMKTIAEKERDDIPMSKLTNNIQQYYRPKLNIPSSLVINHQKWERLWAWVPNKYRVLNMRMIFATYRDGYSLSNLYRHCIEDATATSSSSSSSFSSLDSEEFPNVMLIEAIPSASKERRKPSDRPTAADLSQKATFGVFSTQVFRPMFKYGGSHNTFLFSLIPFEVKFNSTGADNFFCLCTDKAIQFGSDSALSIDSELLNGVSNRSSTFGNEPLCGNNFVILNIEIFKFTM